ncbi:MAG TPA: hypothetical protein VEY11_06410 [Pyrinomonadaceae bacterium]|nr:hypothetical protein [Pyrinomonadaceae bacterium]
MERKNLKARVFFLVYVAIGCFGAIGQTMWLHNDLVHSYPFKMMHVPPSEFYVRIGEVGAIISPAVAIASIFLFAFASKYWIPAVPVAVCPLIFWLVFEYFSWISSYQGATLRQPQFEGYTGETVRLLFIKTSLLLSVSGLIIGFVCGVVTSLVEGWLSRSAATFK